MHTVLNVPAPGMQPKKQQQTPVKKHPIKELHGGLIHSAKHKTKEADKEEEKKQREEEKKDAAGGQ
jgi:hypothetical protein